MYDDTGGVAYVGTSKDLRARIEQHLTRKDSSVTTGVSAVCLVPDNVAKVGLWTHSAFSDDIGIRLVFLAVQRRDGILTVT